MSFHSKMIEWGWINGKGQPLSWKYWWTYWRKNEDQKAVRCSECHVDLNLYDHRFDCSKS